MSALPARVRRMGRDPIARPGSRTVALIFQFLFRCPQATVVAALADPRRPAYFFRTIATGRLLGGIEGGDLA